MLPSAWALATALLAAAAAGAPPAEEPAGAEAVALFDLHRRLAQVQPLLEDGRRIWQYDLVVSEQEHALADGTPYRVWAFGGQIPGPLLVAREGDRVRIRLINETSVAHTLHSHGLFVPQRMDGVPHAHHSPHHGGALPPSAHPVEPGGEYVYEYIARPAGTHFYHCHMNTNEHLDRGMSGPLVVLPGTPEPAVDVDRVLILDEWHRKYARSGVPGRPEELFSYDFFTLNGISYPGTGVIAVELGAVLRLRLVNAGAQAHFMHLHGHSFLVTHKDGAPLAEPLEMDTVALGPGERADLIVRANNPGEWPFHCHSPPHQTNGGVYPGGMMTHLRVGPTSFPSTGEGPEGAGIEALRGAWRRWARVRLGIDPPAGTPRR